MHPSSRAGLLLVVALSVSLALVKAQRTQQEDPNSYNWADLDKEALSRLPSRTFKYVKGRHFRALAPAACAGLGKKQVEAFFGATHTTDHPCESFSRECLIHTPKITVASIPRNCMSQFPPATLTELPALVYEALVSAYLFQVISADQLTALPSEVCALIPPNQLKSDALDFARPATVECVLKMAPSTLSKLPSSLPLLFPAAMCARFGVPQARALSGGTCELLRSDCVAAMSDAALRSFACHMSRPFSAVRDLTLRQATLFIGNYDSLTLVYLWERFGNAIAYGPHQLTQVQMQQQQMSISEEFRAAISVDQLTLELQAADGDPPAPSATAATTATPVPAAPRSAGVALSFSSSIKTRNSGFLLAAPGPVVDLHKVTWLTIALLAATPTNQAFLERHLVELSASSVEGVRGEHIRGLSPSVFSKLQRPNLEGLPREAIAALSAAQVAAIPRSVQQGLLSRFTSVDPAVIPTLGVRLIQIIMVQAPDAAAGVNTFTCEQFRAATPEQKKAIFAMFSGQFMRSEPDRDLLSFFMERCNIVPIDSGIDAEPGLHAPSAAADKPKAGRLTAGQTTGIGLGAVGAAAVIVYALKRRHAVRKSRFDLSTRGGIDETDQEAASMTDYVSLEAGAV